MRFYLGITLLLGIVLIGFVNLWEWLVKTCEPTKEQRETMRTHWLLCQSGIVRREK